MSGNIDISMKKILIFGNSGSGKSTRAQALAAKYGLAHLDLDTIAWLEQMPPQRRPLDQAKQKIDSFLAEQPAWVVEGCYADLLALLCDQANELVFMDLSVEDCIANARTRPWEPHKYASKEAQDENLTMLIGWIEQYPLRQDECSHIAHQQLFDNFSGNKQRYTSNPESSC